MARAALALLLLLAGATAFAPCSAPPLSPLALRAGAGGEAEKARLSASVGLAAVDPSFAFDVQKQLWFYRRCAATYAIDGGGATIVAEGPRAKLNTFAAWLDRACEGAASVEWGTAEGTLEGWTSTGVGSIDAAAAGSGSAAAADEAAPATVAEAASSIIDIERAASVAAANGVVGTVPAEIREAVMGGAFGSAALRPNAPVGAPPQPEAGGDLGLTEEELAVLASELDM